MDNPTAQIKKYLAMVYKRRFLFGFFAIGLISTIVISSYFMPKRYEASSTVFIERNMIDNLMRDITITPSMGDRIRVLRYYMTSRDLISRTLKSLDADVRAGSPLAFEEMIRSYQNRTEITQRGGDLFIVSVRDANPVFARDFVNTLVNQYVEENIASKRDETFGASRFLNEQVVYFKNKLDEIQQKIIHFRREKGIFDTVDESSIIDEIKLHQEELNELKVKKNELLATEKTIKAQLEGEYPIIATRMNDGSGNAGRHSARVSQLEATVKELLVTYTENYPTIIKLRAEIESLKAQENEDAVNGIAPMPEAVDEEIANDPVYVDLKMKLFAVQSEIKALESRQRNLGGLIGAKQKELHSIPEEKKVLSEMERERATYAGMYNKILNQVSRTEVSKQMEIGDKTTTFRIVDPAVLPAKPVTIDRLKVMVMGILGGLVGAFGLALLREKLDGTFKEADELRNFGLPVLAQIPSIFDPTQEKAQKKKNAALYVAVFCDAVFVGALLIHDLLGLTYVDNFIATTGLDRMVGKFMNLVG